MNPLETSHYDDDLRTLMDTSRITCFECLGKGYFLGTILTVDGIKYSGIIPDLHSYRTSPDIHVLGRVVCPDCHGKGFNECRMKT